MSKARVKKPTQNYPSLTKKELLKKLKSKKIKISPLLKKALVQAKQSHGKQKRDSGEPYLEQHIYPVISDLTDSYGKKQCPETLIIAAALHDVLEDDHRVTDYNFIEKFGKEIYFIIKPLTKEHPQNLLSQSEEKKMSINKKMLKIISKSHKFTRLIKLADRTNNLASIKAIKNTNPAKFKRYVYETNKIYLPFAKKDSRYYYTKLKSILAHLRQG